LLPLQLGAGLPSSHQGIFVVQQLTLTKNEINNSIQQRNDNQQQHNDLFCQQDCSSKCSTHAKKEV
jgi:hypothetical protein